MLRLLFCTAAILPIGFVPWMTSDADGVKAPVQQESYAELVTDPNLDALSDCETGELPVFFQDGLVTTHSAEFIAQGLESAENCGEVDITIVPLLPEDAHADDHEKTIHRTAELSDYIEAAADLSDIEIDLDVADTPREEEISTLYINGRAAILRIEPADATG